MISAITATNAAITATAAMTLNESKKMTAYILRRYRDVPLAFDGMLIGEVSTRFKRDRWTELRLYRCRPDMLVAEQVGRSTIEGEIDRCRAWVCENAGQVRKVLGDGSLARELYTQAGLDGTESVESAITKEDERTEL